MIVVDISLEHIDLMKFFSSKHRPSIDEINPIIIEWLKDNYPNQHEVVVSRKVQLQNGEEAILLSHAVIFQEEKAAMHFKLVWGGHEG